MKYLLFLVFFMFLLSACDNDTADDNTSVSNKKNVSESTTNIDELSGYTRDDLLKVFVNEIKEPVDSVFNTCIELLLCEENTLFSDEAKIDEAVSFVEYKIDKFEKFKSYQMDSSIKNKMLDYLKIYLNLLKQDYKEILVFKYNSGNLTEDEQSRHVECLGGIDEKIFAAKGLLEEILLEYYNLHNKA